MAEDLRNRGLPESRIILEERSSSTAENLKYSLELIGDKSSRIGVVTNNFHVFRGVAIGRKLGCTCIYGVSAPYPSWKLIWYSAREILAIVKDKIRGNW